MKAIAVNNVSKCYRIGLKQQQSDSLTEVFGNWLKTPYYSYKNLKKLSSVKEGADLFWALRNISFEVQQGDVLGIVGRNGAGKSTLLKILSRITEPTTGMIEINGRVNSLLEVGTGFHPELTGRENVFLNGTILGMKKKEVQQKFDEIIAFSGVEKFIDTPVKRYSSGMKVRLAFAVAAHLEPEILIIDEVLAVGDAEFQKKCLGKMKDVSGHGRTVLFVSHNMAAVKNLCTKGILLDAGEIIFAGTQDETIAQYLKPLDGFEKSDGSIAWENGKAPGGEEVRFKSIRLLNDKNETAGAFYTSSSIKVEINYHVYREISGSRLILQLLDMSGNVLFASTNHLTDTEKKSAGIYTTTCIIPENLLTKGRFNVLVHMGIPGVKILVQGQPFLAFETILMGNQGSMFQENWSGIVAPLLKWETRKENEQ